MHNRNTYKETLHTKFKYLVGFQIIKEQLFSSYSHHLYNPPFTVIVNQMDRVNIIKKLRNLEQQTDILRRIRKITNELKSNGAYSNKNIALENKQLEEAGATTKELNILAETWANKKKLCKHLWNQLNELNQLLKKEFDFDEPKNPN